MSASTNLVCYDPATMRALLLLIVLVMSSVRAAGQDPGRLIARWSFERGALTANHVSGGPVARIEKAETSEGHDGTCLLFMDWSVKDYLNPDPGEATRVVVPDLPETVPPFRVSAWIYPTAAPIYYGGIVERGDGLEASFRLLVLRGLLIEASAGATRVRSAEPVALDSWHQVGLELDGSALVLLVNGKEVGRSPLASKPPSGATEPLRIGERFTGRIDEVSIERP